MPFAEGFIRSTVIFQYVGNEVFNLLGEPGKRNQCLRISTGSIFTKKRTGTLKITL